MMDAMSIKEKYDHFVDVNGQEPLFAEMSIVWNDDHSRVDFCKFKMNEDYEDDSDLFFNVRNIDDLISLTKADNGEDFVVIADTVEFM